MDYTGQVFMDTETVIAQLTAATVGPVTTVEITVGGVTRIKFPMPSSSDLNEIGLRASNIINQTGLAPNDCRVVVHEV